MSGFAYGDNDNPDQILIDGDISKTLTKYATDPNYETRQEFARTLSHILRQQPLEDILNHIHDFIAAILMVSEDKSPIVRTSLVEQIPYVFLQCHEHACPDLEHYLYDRLLQIVLNYLQDEECEVRRESFSALQLLLEKYVLDKKRIEEKVCPAIICPEHKINFESLGEFNINAITFMGRIAPIIGPQKTEELFLKHFLDMCKTQINSVRRTCANIFPTISYVLGTSITETKLLETFFSLCEDVFWGVRKACAESIALISLVCTLECRRNRIAPIVLKLAKDSNKWVICATFKVLGQIISSFADPCITGLAYSYNGELHITNPVDTDFRDHSDPQIVANYEHYLYMFANGGDNSNNEILSGDSERGDSNIIRNDDSLNKIICGNNSKIFRTISSANDVHNFNDEALSSQEIAQLIIESKAKLVKQINDAVYLKRSIFKNVDAWKAWECDDDKNDSNNISCNKNNHHNLGEDEFRNIFVSTFGVYKNDETSTNSSNTTNVITDTANELIAGSSSSTDSTISDNNNLTESFKTDTWTSSNTADNNKTNTGDISNNINQNSNISETKGRRRSGLLVQAHSFWRKNTPTDLSSIIKKAINEQPQPQQIHQIHLHTHKSSSSIVEHHQNNNKQLPKQQQQQFPLQTPSCNTGFSHITEVELSKMFESLQNGVPTISSSHLSTVGAEDIATSTAISNDKKNSNSCNTSVDGVDISNRTSIDTGFNSCVDPDEEDDEDASYEFNSYKYWHIDPELPLDMKIVENREWYDLLDLMTYKSNKANRINDIVKETSTSKFNPPTNFQQNIVPVGILESYVTMVTHEEEEIKLNCAYNFPAVVLTIGKCNWHILKSLLQFLCDDIDWKVRKTIATSIDLLATILGKKIATRDLVPIYLGFFKDLDEVKIEAIKNFANFLKAIDQSKHEEILSNIGVCLRVDSKTNWRIKEDLAKQICLLIKMYNSINNHDSLLYLTSLTGFFLEDKVSCVREIAADAMSEIIVISNVKQREAIVKYFLVQEFANSDSWRKRQTFLIIFYKLIRCDNPLIDLLHLIFSSMKRLSYDAVPNIRLLVAKNLVHLININEKRKEPISDDILQIIRRLRQDDDRDVRELFDSVDYLKTEEDEDESNNEILNNDNLITTINNINDENNSSKGNNNEDTEIKLKNYNNRLHNPMEGESYSDILKSAPPPGLPSVVLSVSTNKNIEKSKNVVDGNEPIETKT